MNSTSKRETTSPLRCFLAVLAILILPGCMTVGPDYVPPDTSVSEDWHTQLKGGLTAEEMDPQTLAAEIDHAADGVFGSSC